MPDLGVMVRLQGTDAGASAAIEQLIGAMGTLTAAVTDSTAALQVAAQAELAEAAAATEATAATEALTAAEIEATAAAEAEVGALEALAEAGAVVKEEFVGGFGEMAAAFVGFEAAREVLGKTVEAAREMQQTQLQLNAVFGEGAEKYAAFAERVSQGTNFTTVQFERASVALAELQRDYGLTDEQMQQLLATTADLAASSGVELVQAANDISASMRGQTRAGSELGLNLRSQVIAGMEGLTEAQKKAVTGTDLNAAAMARLAAINIEAKTRMGQAAIQAGEEGDKFAQLDKATAHLFETLGKSSAIGGTVSDLAKAATAADNLVQITDILIDRAEHGGLREALDQVAQAFSHTSAAGALFFGPLAALAPTATSEMQTFGHAVDDVLGGSFLGIRPKVAEAAEAVEQFGLRAAEVEYPLETLDALLAKQQASLGNAAAGWNSVAEAIQAATIGPLAAFQAHEHDATNMAAGQAALAESVQKVNAQLATEGERLAALAEARGDVFTRHPQRPTTEADVEQAAAKAQQIQDEADRKAQSAQDKAAREAEQIAREHWDRLNALDDRGLQDARTLEDRQRQAAQQAQMDGLKAEEQNLSDSVNAQIAERERLRDAALKALDAEAQAAKDEHDRALRQVTADEAAAAGGSIAGFQGVGRARTPRQEADERLKAALDSIEQRRKAEQQAAKEDIDGLKAREEQAARTYKQMETDASRFWRGEQDRIADTRRAFDEAMADYRYGFQHPEQGGAGTFSPPGGPQGTPTTPQGGGAFGQVAGWRNVTINQTVNIAGGPLDADTLGQLKRAYREAWDAALVGAGLS